MPREPIAREPITIGDVEVRAGSQATIDLPISDLSTRTPMTMPVQVFHGRREGPRLFVCAAVHGDEINGVEIIRRLLRLGAMKRLNGTLIAVPIVNVFGFVAQSRYLPDRRDLNRSFPGSASGSLTARLAHIFLTQIVGKATHGVDLHTGAIHRSNFPQVRANLDDPEVEQLAHAFAVPLVINTGYREKSLREAAMSKNVPVIVYEAGEALRFDEPCIRAGVKGVTRVMRELGMLTGSKGLREQRAPFVVRSSTWIRAPQSGVLRTAIHLGTQVKAGAVLGLISDAYGEHEVEITAKDDGVVIGRNNLPVVNEGDALFHVGRGIGTQVLARALDDFEPDAAYESGLTSELAEAEQPIV